MVVDVDVDVEVVEVDIVVLVALVEVVLVLVVEVAVVASNLQIPVMLFAAMRADEGQATLYQPSLRTITQGAASPLLGCPSAKLW